MTEAVLVTGIIGALSTICSSLVVFVVTRNKFEARMAEKLALKEKDLEQEIEEASRQMERRLNDYKAIFDQEIERVKTENTAWAESISSIFISERDCSSKHEGLRSCVNDVKGVLDGLDERQRLMLEEIKGLHVHDTNGHALLLAIIQALDLPPKKRDSLIEQFQQVLKEMHTK